MFCILMHEASKHRKLILFYLTACIVVSVFFTPIFGTIQNVNAEEMITEGAAVQNLLDTFTGKSIRQLMGTYSQIVGVSAEPFTALLLIGIIENINHWVGEPMDVVATPAGNPIVLLLVFLFFIIGKLMKSNEATQVFGMITLGELEKYLGLAFVIILGVLNVAGISTSAVNVVNASELIQQDTASGNFFSQTTTVLVSIIMGLISLIIYYIVKTVFWGIEVIQMSVSFIPGSALVFEIGKSLLVTFLVTVNVIFPKVGMALNIIAFLICCIFFKMCYAAMQYFKKIYIRPAIKMINGFNPYKEIIVNKIPRKVKNKFQKELEESAVNIVIPIYPIKRVEEISKVKKYEKWWLVVANKEVFVCKSFLFRKELFTIKLTSTENVPFYINKGFRFFEVFDLMPGQENMKNSWFKRKKRHYSFAFSKEYLYRFDDILKFTEFTDYAIIKATEKQTKKQLREAKRIEKQEKRLLKKLGKA